MTHDELLKKVNKELELAIFEDACGDGNNPAVPRALLSVVELHKPVYWENIHDSSWNGLDCSVCFTDGNLEIPSSKITYPCPTIQAIESALQ